MKLNGQECSRLRTVVSDHTRPSDWEFFDVHTVSVNDADPINPQAAKERLSAFNDEVVSVILTGDANNQSFDFQFVVAKEEHLAGVDDAIDRLARRGSLSLTTIQEFLNETKDLISARRYATGVAEYLYGVLAREGSPDSGIRDYRIKYDRSVDFLKEFDRPAANAICGLVEFHYNQLAEARRRTQSPRIAVISHALLCFLECKIPPLLPDRDRRGSHDYTLSDAETERTLTLCLSALSDTNNGVVTEIEGAISKAEEYDKLKLRIAVAEYHFRQGQFTDGLEHATTLRHNNIAARWANWYSNRVEQQQ
jgi:hypothetical protein